MNAANYISISTFFIAITLIVLNLRSWWKGGKAVRHLVHGAGGVILGATLAICVGGFLGDIASRIAGSGNSIAGTIIPWSTGTSDGTVASAATSGLQIEGGGVATVVLVVGYVTYKAAKEHRKRLLGGLFVGVCLTYTAGVAGIVTEYLIPSYNGTGAGVVAFFEGAL